MRIFLIVIFHILFVALSQITNTRKWRYTERDSLDNAILLYEEKNYPIALPVFESIYHNHPKEEFIKYLYGICCLYRSDKYDESYTALSEVYINNPRIDMIEFDLARACHYNYKFDEAITYLNKHLSYKRIRPEDKANAELLKQYINNAKFYNGNQNKAKVVNCGSPLNSEGEEYTPVISVDESVMLFNYVGLKSKGGKLNARLQPDENGIYTSDIYISQKKDNKFQTPVPLNYINTNANDEVISLSQDGQVLFTYRDVLDGHGDIYISYLTGDVYSQPVKLKGKVNSYSWDGHCSLSADGRTLYFSSERSGGFGGKDLYKASLLADSTWGKVTNLGDSINTPYDEDSPFIHSDGTTLFYSSKGLKSTGGYDIFRAIMQKDSTFKKTENVGYPINTPDNDIYFVLAANGANGYYSSGKKGGAGLMDIYLVEPAFETNKPTLLLLKGDIAKNGEVTDAEIKVENSSKNNSVYKKLRSNKGKYMISLPAGAQYKITYSKVSLPERTYTVNTIGISGFVEKIYNPDFDRPDIQTNTLITSVSPAVSKTTNTFVAATSTASVVIKANTTPTVAVTKINTPTVVITPTASVAKITPTATIATNKTATPTSVTTPTAAVAKVTPTITPTNTAVVKITPTVSSVPAYTPAVVTASFTPPVRPANMTVENFIPLTAAQEKIRIFREKYPDVSADSLDFRVQIAAFKNPKTYDFPHLKNCGKLENLLLLDGITRLTIGGSFKTLRSAYEHNKKVVVAGQNDAFVTVIYKNRRITLEDLETMGIFKKK